MFRIHGCKLILYNRILAELGKFYLVSLKRTLMFIYQGTKLDKRGEMYLFSEMVVYNKKKIQTIFCLIWL